jgi:hypothetical protein
MAMIMAVIFLSVVWIAKGEVPWKLAVAGACILVAHLCIGEHWALRLLKPSWNPWPEQSFDTAVAVLNVALIAAALYFLFSYFFDYSGCANASGCSISPK